MLAQGFTRKACEEVVRRCRFCRFRSGQQLMRMQRKWDGVTVVLSGTAVLDNALKLGERGRVAPTRSSQTRP